MKTCKYCNQTKEDTDFYARRLKCKRCVIDECVKRPPAGTIRNDAWRAKYENPLDIKVCKHCSEMKFVTEFPKDQYSFDGRRTTCQKCITAGTKQRIVKDILSINTMASKARYKVFIGITNAEIYEINLELKQIVFKILDSSPEYLKIKNSLDHLKEKSEIESGIETNINSQFIEYFDGGMLITTQWYGHLPIFINRHYEELQFGEALKSFFVDENIVNVAGHLIIVSTAKKNFKFIVTHLKEI